MLKRYLDTVTVKTIFATYILNIQALTENWNDRVLCTDTIGRSKLLWVYTAWICHSGQWPANTDKDQFRG